MIVDAMTQDLDHWLPNPTLRVLHARGSDADADALWAAARSVNLEDVGVLGRLVRWRIPGTPARMSFEQLFSSPPFLVLHEEERALVSGLVGRIWTLRRDYPALSTPEEFRTWSKRGTARVVFAHEVAAGTNGVVELTSEVRVEAFGARGRAGLATMRPLVRAFQPLIFSDGLAAAVRRAEKAG